MTPFEQTIQKDIEIGKGLIPNATEQNSMPYIDRMERKYKDYIRGLDEIYYESGRRTHIGECTWSQMVESVVDILEGGIHTLQYMAGRLIPIDRSTGGSRFELINHNNNQSNSESNASANSNTNVEISTMFENTFKSIEENLQGEISDEDYEERLSKVKELQGINDTEASRGKKWSKAKGMLNWITDKGAPTFIQLAPLILKMMENPA